MHTRQMRHARSTEAGFTLVEALTAVLILVFGLIGVTNLMLVATTTNTVATQMTSATDHAVETMERLKAISFEQLRANTGGNLTADTGSIAQCDEDVQTCVVPGNFNAYRSVPGVGQIHTLWTVTADADPEILFIRVRSQGTGALIGTRSRAEFTVFRTCTARQVGCP
jgi:hypothetical protein